MDDQYIDNKLQTKITQKETTIEWLRREGKDDDLAFVPNFTELNAQIADLKNALKENLQLTSDDWEKLYKPPANNFGYEESSWRDSAKKLERIRSLLTGDEYKRYLRESYNHIKGRDYLANATESWWNRTLKTRMDRLLEGGYRKKN